MGKPNFLKIKIIAGIFMVILAGLSCVLPEPVTTTGVPETPDLTTHPNIKSSSKSLPFLPPTRIPGSPVLSPTPDQPHPLPTLRNKVEDYIVQPADTLGQIAKAYGVDLNALVKVNKIEDPDVLVPGQQLVIPPIDPDSTGPDFKIIPDSELVYGPASADLDIPQAIQSQDGYLSQYTEDVGGIPSTSAEVIERVSHEYSVNPRLLLAVMEYRSGWLTEKEPDQATLIYPLGFVEANHKGLYRQLSWAANSLNRGFYLWQVNALSHWVLTDGSSVPIADTINSGTAGIQYLMSQYYGRDDWQKAVTAKGFYHTYTKLFGNPFDRAIEPLLPEGLSQPALHLPFEVGKTWSFTGGPHAGWGDGSAWAAMDFAPPGNALGCVSSDEWVVAMADGPVLRADQGAVIQDLDGDGFEQTGWTLLYLHIESRDRVSAGVFLHAGDRIGHPSCEGGVSNGTHVHIARRYNGEWIAADGPLPFNLDGWISEGNGIEYDGFLRQNGKAVEAWDKRTQENQIQR